MKNSDWREEISEVSIALRMPGSPVLTDVKDRAALIMTELDNAYKEIKRLQSLRAYADDLAAESDKHEHHLSDLQEKVERLESQVEHNRQMRSALSDNTKEDTKALEERVERLKRDTTVLTEKAQSRQEKVERLEDIAGKYRQTQSECNCDVECRLKDLYNKVEILREGVSVNERFHKLETPNPCPLGHECKEGKGFWDRVDCGEFRGTFEECGKSCPKKVDERAETIRRAREHLSCLTMVTSVRGEIMQAISIAEQSIKGGGE